MKGALCAVGLVVILLSAQFRNVQIAASFHPERLRLVDSPSCRTPLDEFSCAQDVASSAGTSASDITRHPPVLLVRGNAPLNGRGEFDSGMIVEAVQDRIRSLSGELDFRLRHPDEELSLVVVNLVSGTQSDELAVLAEELRAATRSECEDSSTKNACLRVPSGDHTGDIIFEIIHSPVQGSWVALPPTWQTGTLAQVLGTCTDLTGGAWDLASHLHALTHDGPHSSGGRSTPMVVYFHCMRGVDRTGLLAGTYAMRFLDATFNEVQLANADVGKRKLNFAEAMSLHWAYTKLKLHNY